MKTKEEVEKTLQMHDKNRTDFTKSYAQQQHHNSCYRMLLWVLDIDE